MLFVRKTIDQLVSNHGFVHLAYQKDRTSTVKTILVPAVALWGDASIARFIDKDDTSYLTCAFRQLFIDDVDATTIFHNETKQSVCDEEFDEWSEAEDELLDAEHFVNYVRLAISVVAKWEMIVQGAINGSNQDREIKVLKGETITYYQEFHQQAIKRAEAALRAEGGRWLQHICTNSFHNRVRVISYMHNGGWCAIPFYDHPIDPVKFLFDNGHVVVPPFEPVGDRFAVAQWADSISAFFLSDELHGYGETKEDALRNLAEILEVATSSEFLKQMTLHSLAYATHAWRYAVYEGGDGGTPSAPKPAYRLSREHLMHLIKNAREVVKK